MPSHEEGLAIPNTDDSADRSDEPTETSIERHEATATTREWLVPGRGAATVAAVALLVGVAAGWAGSSLAAGEGPPDLRAMCLTLGEFDVDVFDRLQERPGDGETLLDQPDVARLAALEPLAEAAAAHPDVADELGEVGSRLRLELVQGDLDGAREQVTTLQAYC